ncbi:MAG: asparagine synthase-related protein [Coxiellaceae bacterium]|nr:asparagine synthase-related protein [Coxiellaceae bacterium]
MSAICGIFYLNQKAVTPESLQRMNNAMVRLGPDGSNQWLERSVGLAHQQCCLTRESLTETLPLYDYESGITITADARLSNRKVLCEHFNLPDAQDISDSVLILKAYQAWGRDCPQHLLGEFSVAIWDKRQQHILCFTDHGGNRPIYYYHDNHLFAFATEIKALHTLKAIPKEPNLQRISTTDSAAFTIQHPEVTFFKNIYALPARTLLTVTPEKLQSHIYWQPDISRRITFKSEEEYCEAFQALFSEIIQSKLRSHLPVMTLHSGGLDSSAITAMASHLLAKKNQSLTALSAMLPPQYGGNNYDESQYIHQLTAPNLHIQPICDEWRGPFDHIENPDYFSSGPQKTSRHYLYSAFATAAQHKGARIILDGCHGEKGPSFHGNGYFAELLIQLKWRLLWRESRLHAKRYDRSWLKVLASESFFPLLPAKTQSAIKMRSDIAFNQSLNLIKPQFIRQYRPITDKQYKFIQLSLNTQHTNHRKHQVLAVNNRRTVFGDIMSDDSTPVQLSCPYKDKRMLEFCLALPGNLKVHNGYKRYTIRSGMKGLMPDTLRFRTTKEPFSPDFNDRYNRQLSKANDFIHSIQRTPLMESIINFKRLESELTHSMQTNRCATARDFTSMHLIPRAIYLLAFLQNFHQAQ